MSSTSRDDEGPREVCFLIGVKETVLWSDASSSPVALPDSRQRWEAVWSRREQLVEIAHTHPLGGAHFSAEDESTMLAIDSGLGKKLRYSVVTPDAMLRRDPVNGDGLVDEEPWWAQLIRVASGVKER